MRTIEVNIMKNNKLQIKDMYIDYIDGYSESVEYGQEYAKGLFCEFPEFNKDKLLNNSIYFIRGDKGTGKTILLKYLQSYCDDITSFSEFIRFKSEINEEQKKDMNRYVAGSEKVNKTTEDLSIDTSSIINIDERDYKLAWKIYLIKVIIQRLNKTEFGVFDRQDKNYDELNKLIDFLYETADFNSILPKFKKGKLVLDAKVLKAEGEFEKLNKEYTLAQISNLLSNLYSSLAVTENSLRIFIDELELVRTTKKLYQRDCALIRDLILVVYELNQLSKQKGFNVYIILALRNEVYKNIESIGFELNKPISDYGIQIDWTQRGGENPLKALLEKRLIFSIEKKNITCKQNIWNDYFPPTINNKSSKKYIFEQTWQRPRDLIRLFTLIKKRFAEDASFTQNQFDTVAHDYGRESWMELVEELSATYSKEDLSSIQSALKGISCPFQLSDFKLSVESKIGVYPKMKEFSDKYSNRYSEILSDLYSIGIIGNCANSRVSFSYRGNDDFAPDKACIIHYSLWKYLEIGKVRSSKKIPISV
jgi:hypothetical protein